MTEEQDMEREEADRTAEAVLKAKPVVAQKPRNLLRESAKAMKDRGAKIMLENGQFPAGDTVFQINKMGEVQSLTVEGKGAIPTREYISLPIMINGSKLYRIRLPYNNATIALLGDVEAGYVDFIATKESGQFGRTTFRKQKKVV